MERIKNWFKTVLSKNLLAPNGSRVIFAYHDISDASEVHHSEHYSTTPASFERQINLIENHFDFVSLDEIVSIEPGNNKGRLASITFDDGFLSVKEFGLPFLNSKRIPFSVFLNKDAVQTNHLSYLPQFTEAGTSPTRIYLDEDDVRFLVKNGILIGSHSTSHRVLFDCSPDVLEHEIQMNKSFLEEIVGYKIRHFALPYGKREHYDQKAIDFCRSAGHEFVYSTNPDYFRKNNPDSVCKPIPRIGITNASADEMLFLLNRPRFFNIDI